MDLFKILYVAAHDSSIHTLLNYIGSSNSSTADQVLKRTACVQLLPARQVCDIATRHILQKPVELAMSRN